jgi:hypothetical protein
VSAVFQIKFTKSSEIVKIADYTKFLDQQTRAVDDFASMALVKLCPPVTDDISNSPE